MGKNKIVIHFDVASMPKDEQPESENGKYI